MSEWISKPLGKTVNFQKGRKVETSAEELPGYQRYLGAGSLVGKNGGYASTVNAVHASSKDVLMLWDGERSGLVGYNLEGVVSSTVSKLATLGEVTAPYLYYFLSRNFEWIQNRRTGTGVPHVPKDLGRIMTVNFPKCQDTQNQITTILQTIDEAIEQTETLIEKYSLVKAGMMHDLFTRGLTPDGKLRPPREEAPDLYKETPIGWFPKEWDTGELKTCVRSVQYGISTSLTDAPTGIPVLRMNNIQDNAFDVSDMKYADTLEAKTLKLSLGDVLYNRTNSMQHVGKTAIWRDELEECSFASYLVRVNLDEKKLDREYFTFWMSQVSSQNALRRYATPAVQQVNINPTNLQKIWFSRPSDLDEQIQTVQRIDGLVKKTNAEQAKLSKLKVQKSGLMHDLLSGEVPVNVGEPEIAHV
jgi:type I restriction enzyme S subunit